MAKLRYGYPLAEEICEKLGIDPNDVKKVTTISEVGEAEMIHITLFANDQRADPHELLKSFELVPLLGKDSTEPEEEEGDNG